MGPMLHLSRFIVNLTYLKFELSYCDFCAEISKFSLPLQQGLTQIISRS